MPRVEQPVTLMRAHEALLNERPGKDAPREVWVAYYRRSVALYEKVADLDRGHHHEAMYWAGWERRRVAELTAEPADRT